MNRRSFLLAAACGPASMAIVAETRAERATGIGWTTERKANELSPPPIASEQAVVEVLRVWAKPGQPQQLVLSTTWNDPAAWGLMLADIARHAAKAYGETGVSEAEALKRILTTFKVEISAPTGDTKRL